MFQCILLHFTCCLGLLRQDRAAVEFEYSQLICFVSDVMPLLHQHVACVESASHVYRDQGQS